MKTLHSSIIDELAKQQAAEPLTIVSVQWGEKYVTYSDKKIDGVHGKIKSIGNINHKLSGMAINSSTVDMVLYDTDSLVRGYYNDSDLHKRKCIVYQYFGGLALDKKFKIFEGLTNSPIVWNEFERTISFSVISEVESKEVGFSPEESNYTYVSDEAIGKAWPLCFGDVVHVPAVKSRQTPAGTLKTKMCIVDSTLFYKLNAIIDAYFMSIYIYNYYKSLANRGAAIAIGMRAAIQQYVRGLASVLTNNNPNVQYTPTQQWTITYCYIIGLEDAYKHGIEDKKNELDKLKKELEEKKKGAIPWGNLSPKKHQEKIKEIRDILKNGRKELRDIVKGKKICEDYLDQLDFELDLQRTSFQKQTETFNQIVDLFGQYNDILNEICLQRKSETNTVVIENGHLFPQGGLADLLINGMRVRGTFTGDRFDISVMLPKYRNVPVATRQTALNECGLSDYDANLNTFWISSRDYSLENNWLLVKARNGTYHIIKCTHQEGTECKYDLLMPDQDQSGGSGHREPGSLLSSPISFPRYYGPNVPAASVTPVYNTPRGSIPPFSSWDNNPYTAGFESYVRNSLTKYGADALDADEYYNFMRAERMINADVAEDYIFFQAIPPRNIYNLIAEDIVEIVEVAPIPLNTWLTSGLSIDVFEIPDQALWEATPGTTIIDFNNPYEVYIANILPSDVKCVMAHRVNDKGETYLDVIPPDYYILNEAEDLGDLTVTSLKFLTPLKSIQGEQWEDDVYVSLRSSIGSNVVDELIWLIETYTTKSWDEDSFNYVKELFGDKYPANFALFDRRDILTVLQEIAWQARCQLVLIDEIFYITYLAVEPESVRDLYNADVETGTMLLSYTETEQLVTKFIAKWKEDYLPETEEKEIVLRHNIHKYGLHNQEYNFYIYNIRSLVLKSATFWLLRYANTWKQVSFKAFIKQLDLDVNDCVTLLPTQCPHVKAIINEITYDLSDHSVNMLFWLPVRAGDSDVYPFAWPADTEVKFPLADDDAGGDNYYLFKSNAGTHRGYGENLVT